MTEREFSETKLAFAIRRDSEKAGKPLSWQEAVRLARERLAEPNAATGKN
jgi:hypothetical protein